MAPSGLPRASWTTSCRLAEPRELRSDAAIVSSMPTSRTSVSSSRYIACLESFGLDKGGLFRLTGKGFSYRTVTASYSDRNNMPCPWIEKR